MRDGSRADASARRRADTIPLNVLIDQGKYWQAHQRGDLAEQAWQKVLRIDPKQPDALFGMGMVLADRKDGSGAQQYLARLREVAPNYPNIDELGRRLGETSPRDQTVNDARRLAQSGQSASAVQEYQRALERQARHARARSSSITRRSPPRRKAGIRRVAGSNSSRARTPTTRATRSPTRSI